MVEFSSLPTGVSIETDILSALRFSRFLLVISVLILFNKQEYKKPSNDCEALYRLITSTNCDSQLDTYKSKNKNSARKFRKKYYYY